MCELPNAGMNMEVKYITGTMDAEVTCYDGVIEPGTISFIALLRGDYPKYTREFGLAVCTVKVLFKRIHLYSQIFITVLY